MSTIKQKRVAKAIIENLELDNPQTGGEIVENSGYGKSMRLFPGRILESIGVKEELKRLGFSIEAADQVVWELLHKGRKEETKLKAAQEIYKRMGGYAPDKHENTEKRVVGIVFINNGGNNNNSSTDSEAGGSVEKVA